MKLWLFRAAEREELNCLFDDYEWLGPGIIWGTEIWAVPNLQ